MSCCKKQIQFCWQNDNNNSEINFAIFCLKCILVPLYYVPKCKKTFNQDETDEFSEHMEIKPRKINIHKTSSNLRDDFELMDD